VKLLVKSIETQSTDSSLGISNTRVAAVLLFVILNLSVFLERLVSVLRYGSLFPFDSVQPIYAVWKAVHHLPVYEWPLAYPYSLALYNYLFYYSYALPLRLIGETGAGIMTWGRMFTPVYAIMGAIAQWKLVQYSLNLRGIRSALSFIFALGLWLCTSIVRYWALSIRPDMGAIALIMIALYMIVRQPRFGFAYAGVLFYLAWSFKQTVVFAFVGVCLFLLLHKRWRDLTLLVTVLAALVAATLLLGTPEYRFDILVAPRLVKEFSISWALQVAPKTLLANAYWILAPAVLLLSAGPHRNNDMAYILSIVFVVALIGGLASMTKVGGWDNYLLEAFVVGSTLLQIAIFTVPGRFVSALVLYGCILPAIQAVTIPSGTQMHTFGTVGIATKADYADAVALRDRLAQMKKPAFSTDPMFSLPWISNDNHAPALVIDSLFYDAMRTRCQNGCVEGLLQHGDIPTVVLQSSGDPYQNSLSPKYEKVGEARESERMWSIYVLNPQVQRYNQSIR
jgi:hypothetical protein